MALSQTDDTAEPKIVADRRQSNTDRRTASRQGKFDRRQNRCGHCMHFVTAASDRVLSEPLLGQPGVCGLTKDEITTQTYVCLSFEPLK